MGIVHLLHIGSKPVVGFALNGGDLAPDVEAAGIVLE